MIYDRQHSVFKENLYSDNSKRAKWFRYLIDHHIDFRIRIKCNSQVSNSRGTLVSVENLFRGLPRGGTRFYLEKDNYGAIHFILSVSEAVQKTQLPKRVLK